MKKFIMMSFFFLCIALGGCDDGTDFCEVIVNDDCSNGWTDSRIGFDSESVHCGNDESIYFGMERVNNIDDNPLFYSNPSLYEKNPFELYLYFGENAVASKDSVWILETDSTKVASCEKLDFSNKKLNGSFCLNKFESSTGRDYVNFYSDGSEKKENWKHYIIYSKYNSYKAFCIIESYKCALLYSCVIQYDGTYNFSRIPTLDAVKRKNIWCIFD